MKKDSGSQGDSSKSNDQRGKENAALLARIDKAFSQMFEQQSYPPNKRFMTLKEFIVLVSGTDPEDQISESSMRRVFEVMKTTFNLPVDWIPSRHGHGFTEPVAAFSLDAVSEEQVYALVQSVQMLKVHRASKALNQLRRVVKKACFGITLRLGVEFEEIEEALSFHLVGFDAPAPVEPELFKQAMRAILQKREVRLEHRSVKRRGEVKQKTVEPLHLAMINHGLYLFHYDRELEGKKDENGEAVDPIRKFALTRIGKLEPTGRVCRARKFDVDERVERGMGAFDGKDAVEVELRFSPKVAPLILERPWHKRQEVTEHADGGITLKLRVTHSPELEGAVLRWAGDVEVVSPGKLRRRMWELGDAVKRVHGGSEEGKMSDER
jgi:predicted DNA-binding transcriptional regulator YafY